MHSHRNDDYLKEGMPIEGMVTPVGLNGATVDGVIFGSLQRVAVPVICNEDAAHQRDQEEASGFVNTSKLS